jgi:hypothetical protein
MSLENTVRNVSTVSSIRDMGSNLTRNNIRRVWPVLLATNRRVGLPLNPAGFSAPADDADGADVKATFG